MSKAILLAGGVAILSLAACGSSDQSGSFKTDEGTGSYKVDQSGPTTKMEVTGPSGEKALITSGSGTTATFPDGFSLIPGGKVVSSTKVDHADGSGAMIMVQSPSSVAEMTAFYRKQAEALGIKIEMEMRTGEGELISGKAANGMAFSFNANPGDEGTVGQLIYGSAPGE